MEADTVSAQEIPSRVCCNTATLDSNEAGSIDTCTSTSSHSASVKALSS